MTDDTVSWCTPLMIDMVSWHSGNNLLTGTSAVPTWQIPRYCLMTFMAGRLARPPNRHGLMTEDTSSDGQSLMTVYDHGGMTSWWVWSHDGHSFPTVMPSWPLAGSQSPPPPPSSPAEFLLTFPSNIWWSCFAKGLCKFMLPRAAGEGCYSSPKFYGQHLAVVILQ